MFKLKQGFVSACKFPIASRYQNTNSHKHCQELTTLNDMPIPEGDFFKLHSQRNFRHNSILALGIVMFTSAIYAFKQSKINMNFSPPETYEDE